MSIRIQAAAGLLALATFVAPFAQDADPQEAGSQDEPVEPTEILAGLDWLAGSWIGPMWGGEFHAHYSTPAGGKILSHSRLYQDGKEVFFEFELFEPRDGVVYMQPFPGGRKAVGFPLESHDPKAHKAVFVNPEKDYPTRITYHREEENRLIITLDDPHGGSDKVEVFELDR